MTRLTFVALLLVTTVVSTATGQGGIASCCRRISTTRVHPDHLRGYYFQDNPPCPIQAVVFKGYFGNRKCADPKDTWTRRIMAYLDRRNGQLRL